MDVEVLRPFKHFLDLPLACPQGRADPSHLCAMKYMEGLGLALVRANYRAILSRSL